MQVVTAQLIKDKKVLLRYDFDVPLNRKESGAGSITSEWEVEDDYRLKAGLETLKLCLENAKQTIIFGHIGRPGGKVVPELSVAPVAKWLKEACLKRKFPLGKLTVLENIRFEEGEDACFAETAMSLASMGDFFVNEAFAAHHEAASTTLLPTLLPHAAGLHFAKEVEVLTKLRENPDKPLIALIGGAKVEDKYDAIIALSKLCQAVLVGGLLPSKIRDGNLEVPANVMLGKMSENGIDLAPETIDSFCLLIKHAKEVIWAGPMGKYEDPEGNKGDLKLAQAVIQSGANSVIGGGDTIAALEFYLDKFKFVSVGGGASLELLTKGTIPSLAALG